MKEPKSLSDHSPIITWLKVNRHLDNDSSNEAIINDSLTPLPKHLLWENDSSQKFRAILQSEDIQRMIHDFMNTTTITRNVDMKFDAVENILISTAKRCLKIKTAKKRRCKISSNKKWFDKECRHKRHELRKLSNQKHRDPLNSTLREEYHNFLKQYKNLLKNKRNEYYSNKICELENTVENSNNKGFWNCLKSMDDTMKEIYTPPISGCPTFNLCTRMNPLMNSRRQL